MPRTQRIEEFVACIERGAFVKAIEEFFAEDGTMQENKERRAPAATV